MYIDFCGVYIQNSSETELAHVYVLIFFEAYVVMTRFV